MIKSELRFPESCSAHGSVHVGKKSHLPPLWGELRQRPLLSPGCPGHGWRQRESSMALLSLRCGQIFFQTASPADLQVHQSTSRERSTSSSLLLLSQTWSCLTSHLFLSTPVCSISSRALGTQQRFSLISLLKLLVSTFPTIVWLLRSVTNPSSHNTH